MSKMIQVRNVPASLHRALKVRAAMAGKSMSDLILEELESLLALPSDEELRAQLASAEPFDMAESSAEIVRKERDAA